jgi:hypothetical protein
LTAARFAGVRFAGVRLAGVRLAGVRFAAVRLALDLAAVRREGELAGMVGLPSLTSRAATRRARLSMSSRRPLTSASTLAAPSVVAWTVRSTALRTASTASPFLPFFFLSFFAMRQL